MITPLNNELQVFMIQCFNHYPESVFCNLQDIPNVIKSLEGSEMYVIYTFRNATPKGERIKTEELNTLFKANLINFTL